MNTPPYALIASFLAFTEAQNMQKAAQTLKISQPALTSHLKSFEQFFPQPVFAFEGRRKVLTAFGSEIQNLFKSRFQYLDQDLKLLTERVENPKNLQFKVAGRGEILNLLASKINFPGTLEFVPINTEAVAVGLIERKFDIGISYDLSHVGDLHAKKFFIYDYSIALPANWKIKATKISQDIVEKLVELPFVSHRPHSENFQALRDKYQITKKPYYKKIIPEWTKLAELVSAGEGWTIMPTFFTHGLKNVDAIHIPATLIPEVQFYLLYRKESLNRPWFKKILEQLHKTTA